jgi:hypothetical protein
MRSGPESPTAEVIHLELDFGALELSVDECAELVRLLRERSARPGGAEAGAAADRLAIGLGSVGAANVREEELDAMADAAWAWLNRAGSDTCPERVLLLLDVLRSRHAHE